MRRRPGDVYRKAAELLANASWENGDSAVYSCNAVSLAKYGCQPASRPCNERALYAETMAPEGRSRILVSDVHPICVQYSEARDHRLVMLFLMAAITDAGGL